MMYFEIDGYNALKQALHRMCEAFIAAHVPEGAVFDSKVVANELLTNALHHGGGRAYFTVERSGNEIRIAVRSENEFRPPERSVCSGEDAERGRGLYLVDALASRRIYSEKDGICVILRIPD